MSTALTCYGDKQRYVATHRPLPESRDLIYVCACSWRHIWPLVEGVVEAHEWKHAPHAPHAGPTGPHAVHQHGHVHHLVEVHPAHGQRHHHGVGEQAPW